MALGIYISVPFCRTKCSFCNFASDVFSRVVFDRYVDRVGADIAGADETMQRMGGRVVREVDTIYLGGGTPTVLDADQLWRMFDAVRGKFQVHGDAEVTVECAPGTLTPPVLGGLLRCGVNRVSLGVQSFVDVEASSVGRLHNAAIVRDDIERLRAAGITNINLDLIAGLPHQTAESWNRSLAQTIETGAPHVSVYMLEIDDESRLGRELIAGGTRYHAHFAPDEDATADFYSTACEQLDAAGIGQYEISNFARAGFESQHNLKYWTRQPYLGFGVDAHSMLLSREPGIEAVRFSTTDVLEQYVGGAALQRTAVAKVAALEENFFLGLRLNRGVNLKLLRESFGVKAIHDLESAIGELVADDLLQRNGDLIRLTAQGRLFSNEVFQAFLSTADAPANP